MIERVKLNFCTLEFYDRYVIAVMNEGVNVAKYQNESLIAIITSFFENNPFVYITHRLNSYSVDPNIYKRTSEIESLKGFAVVSKNYKAKVNAQIEKRFFLKPFEIFTSLEKAVEWANKLITTD